MSVLRRIINQLSEPPDTPELPMAQWRALSRQIPLLYCMLLANTGLLAWSFWGHAPAELTLYIPAVLALASVIRTVLWWNGRARPVTVEQARSNLHSMIWVAMSEKPARQWTRLFSTT